MPPLHTSGPWPPGRWPARRPDPGHGAPTPGPALTEPVRPHFSRPNRSPPCSHAPSPAPGSPCGQSIALVVGFDDSEPARRALIWGADLIRARPGALHVIYADHVLIDSDLSGFAHAEMEEAREEKAARVAEAAAEIAAAAGMPYTFERREESPAEAILHAASIHAAAEPASTTVLVTGRSHHAAHHVIGSGPVRLLSGSPYPVRPSAPGGSLEAYPGLSDHSSRLQKGQRSEY